MGVAADPVSWLGSALALALAFLASAPIPASAAEPCSREARAALLAPASSPDDAVTLSCSATLDPGDVVTRRVVLEGRRASGVTLDCRGGQVGRPKAQPGPGRYGIEIRSAPPARAGGAWDAPADITIRDCTVATPVRIWGMAQNGQGEALKLSSRALGHTERAQAAAPTRITLANLTLVASGRTPLYLGPGVTGVTLDGSRVTGRSDQIALYLDAESARNTITNTLFDIETGREVVAVDGSAENRITGNTFRIGWRGGIELYRNCGEGGTIRHQTPSNNTITGNRFIYAWPVHRAAITVGSREGWRLYCGEDAGYPFGSSADDGDHATGNVVENNAVE